MNIDTSLIGDWSGAKRVVTSHGWQSLSLYFLYLAINQLIKVTCYGMEICLRAGFCV